ncbi:MAG: hypothetical protein M0R80_06260 [Proteobacteria bacterium]|jgi:hypothetical protein|nr:hypothetical protein [Pseudomonadota bacterium]
MSHDVASTNRGRTVRFVSAIAIVGALLLPVLASATPPTPLNVMFVANGWCSQEDDIENHFLDLGYNITLIKDYKVKSSTSFAAYDLIVLTESAPLMSAAGLNAIKASGKPVLVVESWTFLYAYRLGLTTSPIARLSDGDTVTSLVDGFTAFTSRVGAEALVHQTPAPVFGVNPTHVKSNVTPLYQTTGCMSGVALFADYTKKIGVTGISDTGSYTIDAWKMFDILVQQIVPTPPEREKMEEVAQAYVDSGLYSFLAQVESDLRQQPGSWTFEQAEEEAWLLTTEWRLDELWDNTRSKLSWTFYNADVPPEDSVGPFTSSYNHPLRPSATCKNCFPNDPLYDNAEAEHWFLGEYWDPATELPVHNAYNWSQYHSGTDLGLGMSVAINGKQYYYMGDTLNSASGPMWSRNDCKIDSPARCDDMIVVSTDNDPTDGIDVSPILESQEGLAGDWRWRPIVIPGVHTEFSPQLQDLDEPYWTDWHVEPKFTAPTGVVTTWIPMKVVLNVPYNPITVTLYFRGVVLWYGTAINPSAHPNEIVAFDDENPTRRPASWVGCSYDGFTFHACYTDLAGDAVPFSVDVAPPPAVPPPWEPTGQYSYLPGEPARFIQVAAVELTEEDFDSTCSVNSSSVLCGLYDAGQTTSRGGLLLYGSGRPYRKSGLFLAFIKWNEIGQVDPYTGKPIVSYYWADPEGTDSGWSPDEQDATSLMGDPPCDNWLQPNYDYTAPDANPNGGCWPALQDWNTQAVFGEISARLVRSSVESVESKIVLLGNGWWDPDTDPSYVDNRLHWYFAWKAPLSNPGDGDFAGLTPTTTKTAGYGAYIIDAFSDSQYTGSDPVLWHTISVSDGTLDTPYGVYTGSETIPWP